MAKRMRREERTLEAWLKAGAYMRLLYSLAIRATVYCGNMSYSGDHRTWHRTLQQILKDKSKLEDYMFADHPGLTNDYLSVFYGDVSEAGEGPRFEVSRKVVEMAREIVDEMFEPTGYGADLKKKRNACRVLLASKLTSEERAVIESLYEELCKESRNLIGEEIKKGDSNGN